MLHAAKVMRERARAVPEWNLTDGTLWVPQPDLNDPANSNAYQHPVGGADPLWADHIAGFPPPLALTIAELIETEATAWQNLAVDYPEHAGDAARLSTQSGWHRVAREYLAAISEPDPGEPSDLINPEDIIDDGTD